MPTGETTFRGIQGVELPEFETYNYRSGWTKVANVNLNPYNGIAKLYATYPKADANGINYGHGTGFVAANGKVMTAAHILYDPEKGGRPTSLTLTFLKNGTSGTGQSVSVTNVYVPSDWVNFAGLPNSIDKPQYDYGFIKIPTTGKMTFGLYACVYQNTNYTISGYPVGGNYNRNFMYTDTAKVTHLSTPFPG